MSRSSNANSSLHIPGKKRQRRKRLPEIIHHPELHDIIGPSTDHGDYIEIPLMLPFISDEDLPVTYDLPLSGWQNTSYCTSSENSRATAIETIARVLSNCNVEDRAIARFTVFAPYYRINPLNHSLLSRDEQWIPPIPFTPYEEQVALLSPYLHITWRDINGVYFPDRYNGIRQAFRLNSQDYRGLVIHRGLKVILGDVIGDNVTYRVTRIRFIQDDIAGIEIIGITSDGFYHSETSLGWPPILVEFPISHILQPSFPV